MDASNKIENLLNYKSSKIKTLENTKTLKKLPQIVS